MPAIRLISTYSIIAVRNILFSSVDLRRSRNFSAVMIKVPSDQSWRKLTGVKSYFNSPNLAHS